MKQESRCVVKSVNETKCVTVGSGAGGKIESRYIAGEQQQTDVCDHRRRGRALEEPVVICWSFE
ncbi:hypothetical protein OF83DRAFT_1108817 [Amylostereum chailletii]|nr:hypothetical protein OF83DRAFT_1108817 [Amylostereum chailletii]